MEVLPSCRYHGLGFIPYSPLAGGLLWGVLSKQKNGERRFREQELKIIEKLRYQLEKYENLAAELKITPANLALA
nr:MULTISPECIES: aldo/keto reductase [unclassified Commensalibacter]